MQKLSPDMGTFQKDVAGKIATIFSCLVLMSCEPIEQDIPGKNETHPPSLVGEFSNNCSISKIRKGSRVEKLNGYELFRLPLPDGSLVKYSIRSPHTDCIVSTIYPSNSSVRFSSFLLDDHGISLASEQTVLSYIDYLRKNCSPDSTVKLDSCEEGLLTAVAANGVHLVLDALNAENGRPRILTVVPSGAFQDGQKL